MLGIDAEIWYLPQADRPTTTVIPNWTDVNKNDLVEFCQASRTRLTFGRSANQVSTKCEPGTIDVNSYGDMQITAECEFPWELGLPTAEDFFEANILGRNVAAAILDSALFNDVPAVISGQLGVWGDWLILDWNQSHPMVDNQRVQFRMVPAWSGYNDTTAPATKSTVTRAFTEIISPYA